VGRGQPGSALCQDLDRTKRPLNPGAGVQQPRATSEGNQDRRRAQRPVHRFPADPRTWEDHGWEAFVVREAEPMDLIVPRDDGTQRFVSASEKQFKIDRRPRPAAAQRV